VAAAAAFMAVLVTAARGPCGVARQAGGVGGGGGGRRRRASARSPSRREVYAGGARVKIGCL
jgi:hypothetical protein